MKSCISILIALLGFYTVGVSQSNDLPKPTPSQLAWQEAEIGFLVSYDLHVFDGKNYSRPGLETQTGTSNWKHKSDAENAFRQALSRLP